MSICGGPHGRLINPGDNGDSAVCYDPPSFHHNFRTVKPPDNGFIGAFNGKLWRECLKVRCHSRPDQWRTDGNLMSLEEAREKGEDWHKPDLASRDWLQCPDCLKPSRRRSQPVAGIDPKNPATEGPKGGKPCSSRRISVVNEGYTEASRGRRSSFAVEHLERSQSCKSAVASSF